jgi:hypothetical protein
MDLNKIQLTFKETMKIENIISQIKLPNGSSNINEKIKAYLNIKASQIIKYHNPYLDFNINNNNMYAQNSVLMLDYVPRYVFMIAYTITHLNHPYLIYFNLDDKYINVLIPLGKDYKQADTQYYINVINEISLSKNHTKNHTKTSKIHMSNMSNTALLAGCYVFLKDTLKTRINGILYSQYSILTCDNMTLCHNKLNELSHSKLSESEYKQKYKQYQEYYMKIGIELLQKYFTLLDKKNYSEAYELLKGGVNKFSTYYGKTRLNTFFRNNKTIIGHLEVFISLYELLHLARMKLLNY